MSSKTSAKQARIASNRYCEGCNSTKHNSNICRISKEQHSVAMAIIMTPVGIYYNVLSKITLKTIITILKKGLEPRYYVEDIDQCDRTIFKLDTSLLIEKKPLSKYTYKQLYIICEHGINSMHKIINEIREKNTSIASVEVESCPVCMEDITSTTNTCTTNCGHTFCSPCFTKLLNHGVNSRSITVNCPMCRAIIIY